MKLSALAYFCLWSVTSIIKVTAQTCGALNDSCPSTSSSRRSGKGKSSSSPRVETRLVPICITRRGRNGGIRRYETRCVAEDRDPRLGNNDDFECGCCTFEQQGQSLPDFCGEVPVSGGVVPSLEPSLGPSPAPETESPVSGGVVPSLGPTLAPEPEICEEELIFCRPENDEIQENEFGRRTLGESAAPWGKYGSVDNGDAKSTKMGIRRNRILDGQKVMSTKRRRAQMRSMSGGMMMMSSSSRSRGETPLVAICTVAGSMSMSMRMNMGKSSSSPTFETRCVDPTEEIDEDFTCGCCEGEEDLCIVSSDAPSLAPSLAPTSIAGRFELSIALCRVQLLRMHSHICSFYSSLLRCVANI